MNVVPHGRPAVHTNKARPTVVNAGYPTRTVSTLIITDFFSVRKFQNEVSTEVLNREFYGKIHESFRVETSPVPPTLKLPDAAGRCPNFF